VNDLPISLWNGVRQLIDRLNFALARQWHTASQSLVDDLFASLGYLVGELNHFKSSLPPKRAASVARPSDVVADLAAIELEFAELEIDLQEKKVSVLTDPIVLEGTHLGPFQIVLLGSGRSNHRLQGACQRDQLSRGA
jgi:hypothetical protein